MGLIYKNGVPYAGIPDKINATTVNGYTVESDVPANAKFTDNSDIVSEGKIVSFEDLQGGVPFSEVSINGANGTSVVVSTCGKNLLPVTVADGYTAAGVTIKVNADGTFTLSGTTTGLSTIAVSRPERVITENMILSCNNNITGMTAKATVVRNGETIYLTITSGSKLYVGDILTNVYIQQQESGIEVSGTGGYQLELGTIATEYVPYTGAEYTFTPDSDSYTVTTNIMQQDGVNVLSVTGDGEPTLSVIAVKNNTAIAKLWNDVGNGKVDKEDGKGLSSNDFTTEEKTKLAGLENYDDTALTERVASAEDDIATISESIGKSLKFIKFGEVNNNGASITFNKQGVGILAIRDSGPGQVMLYAYAVSGEGATLTPIHNKISNVGWLSAQVDVGSSGIDVYNIIITNRSTEASTLTVFYLPFSFFA